MNETYPLITYAPSSGFVIYDTAGGAGRFISDKMATDHWQSDTATFNAPAAKELTRRNKSNQSPTQAERVGDSLYAAWIAGMNQALGTDRQTEEQVKAYIESQSANQPTPPDVVRALQSIHQLGLGPDQGTSAWQAEQAHQIAAAALASARKPSLSTLEREMLAVLEEHWNEHDQTYDGEGMSIDMLKTWEKTKAAITKAKALTK